MLCSQVRDVYNESYPGLGRPETEKLNKQCSIIILNASAKDDGNWTCEIHVKGKILHANKKVILTGKQ